MDGVTQLLKSLQECQGFDPTDQIQRYGSGGAPPEPLLRTAAVALYYRAPEYYQECLQESLGACYVTCPDENMADVCQLYGALLHGALNGLTRQQLLDTRYYPQHMADLLHVGTSMPSTLPDVKTMCQALVYIFFTANSYRDGVNRIRRAYPEASVLLAAYGQLAGAYYGLTDIPLEWLSEAPEIDEELIDILDGYCAKLSE
jgi:ADP-ribosylglycohydrolase